RRAAGSGVRFRTARLYRDAPPARSRHRLLRPARAGDLERYLVARGAAGFDRSRTVHRHGLVSPDGDTGTVTALTVARACPAHTRHTLEDRYGDHKMRFVHRKSDLVTAAAIFALICLHIF